jgi:hypothetical protein
VNPPTAAVLHPPSLGNVPKKQGCRFLTARFLTVFAACLCTVLVAYIVLEALDDDLDLWPFGAENFTVAPHADLVIGSQPFSVFFPLNAIQCLVIGSQAFSVFFALNAVQCLVMTAGAHLVIGHRPRSALATDSLSISLVSNLAEPWGNHRVVPWRSAISFGGQAEG